MNMRAFLRGETLLPEIERAERWRPVVDFEDLYEVSDLGRVRSLLWSSGHRRDQPLIRKPHEAGEPTSQPGVSPRPRYMMALSRDKVQFNKTLHHLVLEAFVGPRPDGHYGRFINDDTLDPRLINVEWSPNETIEIYQRERNTVTGKLVVEDIGMIRDACRDGETAADLGERLGVHRATILRVRRGRTWAEVGGDPLSRHDSRTPDTIREEAVRRWIDGQSMEDAARDLGISGRSVHRFIHEHISEHPEDDRRVDLCDVAVGEYSGWALTAETAAASGMNACSLRSAAARGRYVEGEDFIWTFVRGNRVRLWRPAKYSPQTPNKLTAGDVAAIRERLARGEAQRSIARDYGVSQSSICNIKRGRTWKSSGTT
jgi:transposase-like protein